jgi:KDO2-lipid IV(A) lauroyltransferase
MHKQAPNSLRPFLSPRYWPTWLGLGALWLVTQLPYRVQLTLGRWLGILSYYVLRYRRHIAEVNLRLCFPELTDKARKKLLKENFASVGMGAFEMAMSWWTPVKKFENMITIHGKENYAQALSKGKGTIFVGGHFTSLDLIGKLTTDELALDVMYRPSKNKLIDTLLQRQRENSFAASIDRNNLRGMLRQLAKNRTVWYAPDQDYGRKYSVFAPFFGVNAATITATARLAKLSGAAIVPAFQYRLPNRQGYEVIIHPPLENFPSGDDVQDATRINQILETAIRHAPEQYLWQHRRFKTRPIGEKGVY